SRNFGLADTSRADHDDVLRHDLFAKVWTQLLPSPPVTQGDGYHALGVLLADDIAIQFLHDLSRRQVVEAGWLRAGLRGHGRTVLSVSVLRLRVAGSCKCQCRRR